MHLGSLVKLSDTNMIKNIRFSCFVFDCLTGRPIGLAEWLVNCHKQLSLKLNVIREERLGTVEPRSKAPAYKAMFAYKAFKQNPQHIFCSTVYIVCKAFSL